MSRGALLQLVAKNEIDNYLADGDLTNSVFQNIIKKVTNFSEVPFSFYASSSSKWGDTIRFRVNKVGDLITQMYLVLKLPSLSVADINDCSEADKNEINSTLRVKWNNYIGNSVIEYATLKIGGQIIDRLTGEFLQLSTNLYDSMWSKLCMIGHHNSLNTPQTRIDDQYIYVPLRFFFCTDLTKALPVIALEYHDIEVEIKLRTWDFNYLVLSQVSNTDILPDGSTTAKTVSKRNFSHTNYHITLKNFTDIRLDCNFILLDGEERINMAKKRHEILITQTQQMTTNCNITDSIYLNFTNPIKELIFVFQRNDYALLGEIFNYSGKPNYIPLNPDGTIVKDITDSLWDQIPDVHLLDTLSIEFNGIERVPLRDYKYWHYVQNYENYKTKCDNNIYMYSFGLNSKENMGSCNFSMLETVRFNVKLAIPDPPYTYLVNSTPPNNTITVGVGSTITANIYGCNYNIFVIESGMGGLMYTI
jgi:hypothetical protein